jgi:hypothetical protein
LHDIIGGTSDEGETSLKAPPRHAQGLKPDSRVVRPTGTDERDSMNITVRMAAIAASTLTAVALLSGCSATSGSDSPPRAAAVGEAQDTAMVMVHIDDTEASGEVGDTFSILESYETGATFVVDNPGILEVTQPRKVGEEAINASALALAIGTATVTGRFPDGSTWDYFITVKPAPTQ